MNTNTRDKGRNKRFNEFRQLAYVLGTEGRRSYSTELQGLQRWSEDPTREIMR